MADTSKIKERIKKLLRLGQSPSQAEAEEALRKAFELAQEHRLNIEDLQLEKDLEPLAEKAFRVGQNISYEHKRAASIAEAFFGVHVVLARPHILLFGTETDIAIAEYVIEFLVGSIRRGLKGYRDQERKARRVWSNNKRASYIQGFTYAMFDKLGHTRHALDAAHSKALILVDQRAAKFAAASISARGSSIVQVKVRKTRRVYAPMQAGWDEGQRTDIRKPIETDESRLLN